jgi:hypothetical protein
MTNQQFKTTNTLAMASIVSAAVAWIVGALGSCIFTLFFPPVAACTGLVFLIGSVTAVATGYMGRSQIRDSGDLEGGADLAMFGIIAGWIGLGFGLISFCLIIFVILGIGGLALLGPDIGDVFSEIVRTLEAPSIQ